VDRAAAIDGLPPAYGRVVRLVDAGCDLATVARRLEIAPEAVAPLLEVAEAKLARLLREDSP
jgi:DNA-directed RNA polymerase specialized sigma24 family protein